MDALVRHVPGRHVLHHARRAAALGVHQQLGSGVAGAGGFEVRRADPGVHVALAVPHVHAPAEDLLDVGPEPHVGAEQDLRVGAVGGVDVAHHLDRVGRGAAVVAERLHGGRRVDVHHHHALAGSAPARPASCSASIESASEQPASRSGIRTVFDGTQHRGRLGHEVHAAEDDRLAVGGRRPAREAERVADVVGHVLDLRQLVVVGQDHRPALGRERPHLLLQLADLLRGEARRGCLEGAIGRFMAVPSAASRDPGPGPSA